MPRAFCGLIVLLLAAFGLRLMLARSLPLESDEAIGGLAARHILQGERPIFYHGQDYMGILESYVEAAVFAVAGSSTFTLRLVPIAFSLAFCTLTYVLGRRIYEPAVGAIAALYVAVSPLFLTVWSVKGRTHYVETLVFGGLLLLLLLDVAYDGRRDAWRLVALGLVAGLAFWTNLLVVSYLIVVAALLALLGGSGRSRLAALIVPTFALGSLPLWLANASSNLATFRQVAAANAGESSDLASVARNLARLWSQAFPVLLGWAQPTSNLYLFAAERADRPLAFAGGAVVGALLLLLVLHRLTEIARLALGPPAASASGATGGTSVLHAAIERTLPGWRAALSERDLPLLALFLVVPLLFAADRGAPLQLGEPRYVLPLYSTVPVFAAYLWRLGRRSRPALVVALAALVALNVQSNLSLDLRLAVPSTHGRPLPASNDELVSFLLNRGDTGIYADYWIAYAVAFQSEERIVAGVIGDDLRRGFNRYIPHAQAVDTSPSPAFVFVAGSAQDGAFADRLRRVGASYRRSEVGGYAVYDAIDPPQRVLE